jgi:hypothetical protein
MFVTHLEHEGHTWAVELRRTSDSRSRGAETLEFLFSRTGATGDTVRYTWQVSGESLAVLSEQGIDVSEDLLHRYLGLALAEVRAVDATGMEPGSKIILPGEKK